MPFICPTIEKDVGVCSQSQNVDEVVPQVKRNQIDVFIPMRTVSEANSTEFWRIKHNRHTEQQRSVSLFLKPWRDKIKLPCNLILTRYAPRKLDKRDNLPMSFKYILDRICAIIMNDYRPGRADDTDEIEVKYDQVPSKEYGIRIQISWDQSAES